MAQIILVVASIALLMAVTGVYCVLSFAVNQRKREFGIKMVLGASRVEILRLVLVRAVQSIALGLVGGLALAEPAMFLLNRLLARSPFPIHRFDSAVFGISAVLLAVVSLIATYIPAARARCARTRCRLCERNSATSPGTAGEGGLVTSGHIEPLGGLGLELTHTGSSERDPFEC